MQSVTRALFLSWLACSCGAACSSSGDDGAGATDAGPGADLGVADGGDGSMVDTSAGDTGASADASIDTARGDGGGDASATVRLSFAYVGCNRISKADVSTSNPSTANLEQLKRTFAEVAALEPKPKYFFFVGDMVLGYTNEIDLETQLTAWSAIYAASPLAGSGVKLVALPGNHEMENKAAGKLAYRAAETTFVRVMAPYILGSNGPKAGTDGLTTDQSKLTYSFDDGDTHFVMVNTDPVGADGSVPLTWLTSDITAARKAGAKHVFVLGHKPAYPAPPNPGDSLVSGSDALFTMLESQSVEAMLASHNHLWWAARPKGKTWQVVAGNGGSELDVAVGTAGVGTYFGFSVVQVMSDGTVSLDSHGRDVPASGYLGSSVGTTTTIREHDDLTFR